MTAHEIIQNAFYDGVSVSDKGTGKIGVKGNDQGMIDKWLPVIRENKAAILTVLNSQKSKAENTPPSCKGCTQFEVVDIQGRLVNGCLSEVLRSEFSENWKRLPENLEKCPFSDLKTPTKSESGRQETLDVHRGVNNKGLRWINQNYEALQGAGFTDKDFFGKHGIADLELWKKPDISASLDGSIISFSWKGSAGKPVRQTCRPKSVL